MALPCRHRIWRTFSVFAIAVFLTLHAVYLVPVELPASVTRAWGALLFGEVFLFFFPSVVLAAVTVPLVAILGLLVLARRTRSLCVECEHAEEDAGCVWALRPWLHSALWLFFLLAHVFLDIDPLLVAIWVSAAVVATSPLSWRPLVWLAVALLWISLGLDAAQQLALAILSAGVVAVVVLGSKVSRRDAAAAWVGLLLAVQVSSALAPIPFEGFHGGSLLGSSMAYSFCEPPEGDRVFAAVRDCGILGADATGTAEQLAGCNGRIEEFELPGLKKRAEHRFFSEAFFGRFEQLACLEDTVQAGMDWTVVAGRAQPMSLLEFDTRDPSVFRVDVLGGASGNFMAWDRVGDAVYYLSEEVPLVRLDLATDEVDEDLGVGPVMETLGATDIGIHENRRALFLLDRFGWIQEIGLDDLAVERSHSYGHGWELAVDQPLDRLYVSGTFGFEVIDLETGRLLGRSWLGLGGRRPAIDYRNDRIYVPVEGAGKLHVLDRRSLEHLGSIPLGGGIRLPYVTQDGRWLLASNAAAYFRWSATDLARRFAP